MNTQALLGRLASVRFPSFPREVQKITVEFDEYEEK